MGRFGGSFLFIFALLCMQTSGGAKHGGGSCKNCKNKNHMAHNSQRLIASPINLLNPDRYEFFTLDDKGKVVKRIMTFKEIQSIVAGSDITEQKLFANKNNNDRIVSSVVSNVRNVLNNELNLMNGHDHIEPAELPISDVISTPQEPSATATMYDVLNKLGESLVTATSKRTTIRPTTIAEQTSATPMEAITVMPSKSTESSTTRLALKTTQKPTARITKRTTTTTTTARPTPSSTERTTETTAKLRSSSTARPTVRSTTELPSVRSTIKHTASKTTQQPATTTISVQTTRQSTVSSSARPTETSVTVQSTIGRSTTTEAPLLKWAETSLTAVRRTTEAPASKPSTTSTELPMFKEAQATATPTVAHTTEAPMSRTSEMSLPTVKTTATAFTNHPTKAPLEQLPQVAGVTVKPADQSVVEHSSQRSEEISEESDKLVEYSTEQSSEKWTESGLIESYTTSEEASAEGTTQNLPTQLDEDEQDPTVKAVVGMVTLNAPESSTPLLSLESTTPKEQDSETSADESSSTDELYKLTGGLSTWFMDPVTQLATTAENLQETASNGVDQSETTLATSSVLDEEAPLATTTSLELDSTTVQQDSTGYSDEQQQFDEMPLTTMNLYSSQEATTAANGEGESFLLQTDPEQTVPPQDTSTIPSDAQHAIHKIIESLQSINDASASDESDEADSQESNYPGYVPGMNYDAQSSINAIIQSLGQGALGGGDSSIFSITTDTITTPEEELTTVTLPVVKQDPTTVFIATEKPSTTSSPSTTTVQQTTTTTTTTTTLPVVTTSKPVEVPEEPASSTSNFNYNTNIMETIEKFLSSFGSLPKENTYSANLTDLNILSDYPAEINMTDYVDRTATVASVLKFPQPGSREEVADDATGEAVSLEDTTTESELTMLAEQPPILSDPMASFMKLGEMLTMGTKISSTEIPIPVQLEVKTVVDEEETELLRFLSICSNLGTTVYDYLTDSANVARSSMSGRSLVYSPFATITTLSMLFLGTRGTTAESINGVIGLDEMTSFNPHLFFKSIAADLTPKYRRTFAREGNGLTGADSTFSRTLLSDESRGGLQRFFKARIQEIYSTVAETVDFRQKDMLLKHMNGDFPREYVDTLKQLRSPLVSISRNRYRHDCNGAATTFGTMQFKQRSIGSTSVVPSVTFRSGFSTGYSKVLDATVLALPGSTSNVSVYFIKPATAIDVSVLETHLRNQSISNVLKLFPDETVRTAFAEVQLPYFTQTTIYNMTESIRQLGLQNLFEPNVANFNGLQDSSTSNLHLSEFIQTDSFALCGAAAGEIATRTIPLRSFSTNLIKQSVEPMVANRVSDRTGDRLMRRNGRKLALRNRSAFDSVPHMEDSSSSSNSATSKLVFDTPFLYLVRHNPTGMVLYVGRFVGNA